MARQSESAAKRIQVGILGLLVVLICVSVASFLVERSSKPQQHSPENMPVEAIPAKAPDEPLAELGVAPPSEVKAGAPAAEPSPDLPK